MDQREDDLNEAEKLESMAEGLSGKLKEDLLLEAAALREKHQPPPEMVALASVSAATREADLAEADRISTMAATLRPGAARTAMEAEAAALRAKWPDFPDDSEGQLRRISAFLLGRGLMKEDTIPARAILALVFDLESKVATSSNAPKNCHGCGLPQMDSGPAPVNSLLISAIKTFETDANFRKQVTTGIVEPGQMTHPWIPGSQPHKGPNSSTSPWALPALAHMIRGERAAAAEVGPHLRAALKERGLSVPTPGAPTSAPGSARLLAN